MNASDLIYCAIIISAIAIVINLFIHEHKTHIVPAPSMPAVRRAVIDIIHQHYKDKPDLQIIDIGSGWGGFIKQLRRAFPAAQILGYELSPLPYFVSRLRTFVAKNIVIKNTDFFHENLRQADIVIAYLSHWHMKKIADGAVSFKPGSIFISCSFPLPDRAADYTHTAKSVIDIPIYIYKN